MTQPKHAANIDGDRYYTLKDGRKFVSVTTVLKRMVAKPALLNWAVGVVADAAAMCIEEYFSDDKERALLKAYIDECGFDSELFVKDLKKVPFVIRDEAAAAGDELHDALNLIFVNGGVDSAGFRKVCVRLVSRGLIDSSIVERLMLVADWMHDMDVLVKNSELSVANEELMYAGTCDMIATVGGEKTLIDLKTGRYVYDEAAYQLVAYKHATHTITNNGELGELESNDDASCGILHLGGDSVDYYTIAADHNELFQIFKGMLYAFSFEHNIERVYTSR